jgi:TetR/AcrR family transcriptional regulator, transcriptional repressor of bet genes
MDESMTANAKIMTLPRKASREQRRLQLIESTIATIARKGYSQATLTDVARAAGLSHGLVNFHFQSKEQLLTETLLFMAAEYQDNWRKALAAAQDSPAAQLDALIRADFNPAICTQDRLAAWCGFWGEAQSRPIYQQECGANDLEYTETMEEICARLIAEGGYRQDPVRASRIIRVTTEGTWLEIMTLKTPYSLEEALATVYVCASALFPKHFTPEGLIRR